MTVSNVPSELEPASAAPAIPLEYEPELARTRQAEEQKARLGGVVILLVVTLIWGTTFVVTRSLVAGAAPLPPSMVTAMRFGIATMLFLPFLRLDRRLWLAGLELGFWLWCGYASQAVGLLYTTPGRSAFITALNVVFVPALAALFGRRIGIKVWLAAAVALGGTALLSYDQGSPNAGDAWTLVCAITYAVYILRLEAWTSQFRAMPLTAVQLAVVALMSVAWIGTERLVAGDFTLPALPTWKQTLAVVYLALVATAVTTWLQTIGQRTVPGPQAALLYTTEPVFAFIFTWMMIGEMFALQGAIGAAAILVAAIWSQWPARWAMRGTGSPALPPLSSSTLAPEAEQLSERASARPVV